MPSVKVLPKGQITLPKEFRKQFHILDGDTLIIEVEADRAILRKSKSLFDFKGALPDLGMSIDEIRDKALTLGAGDHD
ncbi:MAG: AbrB/MazE/SpoVT family DNA-binding domain-containing protein [Acidobacteria bacterium]|nr:AbrB/MazE/SpoVT family DNA-binding domain-containing protein [Acidobacteriota bacterium]